MKDFVGDDNPLHEETTPKESSVDDTPSDHSNDNGVEVSPVPPVKPTEGAVGAGQTPSTPSMKQVVNWLTMCCRACQTQPRTLFDEKSEQVLMNSMRAIGQQCPCIGYVDPNDPSIIILVDGERRLRAALRLQLKTLEVVVLPAAPSAPELLLAQLALGQVREKLTITEQASAFATLMKDLNLTQQELAEKLGCSETKVSSTLCIHRLLPELKPLAAKLEPSVVPLIARLPQALQKEVIEYATTPLANTGRVPSRAQVEKLIKSKKKTQTVRVRAIGGRVEGRGFKIELREADNHDAIVGFLQSLINSVKAHKNVAVEKLSIALGG